MLLCPNIVSLFFFFQQEHVRHRPSEIPHNEKLLSLKYEVKHLKHPDLSRSVFFSPLLKLINKSKHIKSSNCPKVPWDRSRSWSVI